VPFECMVSRKPPLAIMRGFGVVDAEMWQTALQHLTDDPLFRSDIRIVIDITDVVTPLERFAERMAIDWLKLAPHSRGGIVTRTGLAFEVAREVETMTGHRLRVFTDADAAFGWLRSPRPHGR
jgi:hypothetical protein